MPLLAIWPPLSLAKLVVCSTRHIRVVAGSERVPLWWPFFPLEACQSRVTRLCAALVPISTGGTDDHFMKPPRVRWRQEATPDNETGTCTRLYSPSLFLSSGKEKKFVEIFDNDRALKYRRTKEIKRRDMNEIRNLATLCNVYIGEKREERTIG